MKLQFFRIAVILFLYPVGTLSGQLMPDTINYQVLEQKIEDLHIAGKTLEATQLERELGVRYLYELYDIDRAIALLLKTIHSLENLKDSTLVYHTREDLARIYASNQYHQEALFHFDILEQYYRTRKDEMHEGIIQSAMADVYVAMDSLQKAIPYYQNVEEIIAKNVPSLIEPHILPEIHDASITALTRKGYAIAGLTDTTALDFGGLVDNTTELHPLNLLNSGHWYRSLGEVRLAQYYYRKCLEKQGADEVMHRDALFQLAEIHKDLQQWDTAYLYLARYSVINDSLINDRRQRVIDRLLVHYNTAEQKAKVRELTKDQRLLSFQNRLQNVLTFSLLFGSAIILIGAYFTIRNYQHRFNANQIIHTQTQEINRQRITELENNVKIESMHSMIQGQEAERERVAKDLHDSLGGLLSTVKLHFDSIQSQDAHVGRMPEYQRAYTLLDEACKEVRQISNDLQPSALHKLGLVPAVNDLINRVRTAEAPKIDFRHYGLNGSVDPRVTLNVFRIVQELLSNSLRHSGASHISLVLSQTQNTLSVVVQDNGKGYEPGTAQMGMGTENISSRVNYLKGDLSIHSVIGEGTTTQIDIPV
jgi:signal transduction histidine kinase